MSEKSGIYVITCLVNNKVYVGSAVDFQRRWNLHRSKLNKGQHYNRYLQSSWEKYGAESFTFGVLEWVQDLTLLVMREQHWIDFYNASNNKYGFNTSPTAGSPLGIKRNDEFRAKMSAVFRGRKFSTEHRAKIGAVQRGRKASPETRVKMSAAQRRRKFSDEHRAKLSEANRGHKHSAETRVKLSEVKRECWRSDEYRARMSAAQRERRVTSQTRAKIGAVHRGRKFSAEHRANLSARGGGLDDTAVAEVRRRLALGDSQIAIAADFGCCRGTIKRIKSYLSPYEVKNIEGTEQDEPDWVSPDDRLA